MTELLAVYPDAEDVMRQVLTMLPGDKVVITDDTIVAPLTQVTRVGGPDDGLTDHAHIEVACFGESRAQAWQQAGLACQLILAARATEVVQSTGRRALIDHTVTITPAELVPYDDQELYLVVGVYQLSMRRTPAGR